MLYETMLAESKRLEKEISSLQTKLSHFPDGKIFCVRDGKRVKWYQSDGEKQSYIPRKERGLAEQLAIKKYLTLQLQEHEQEKRAIDFYLRHHNLSEPQSEKLLLSPEYQEFLTPFFSPKSQELISWMNEPYDKNPKYPEQLIHKTASGHLVRSKSEAIIDMLLYTNQIPFRYECALQLGAATIYPDFTIRHPRTGDTIYYEHFGLMDDPNYCKNATSKLQLYTSHGIIPTINLITTYETKDNPLSPKIVENIIRHYFL